MFYFLSPVVLSSGVWTVRLINTFTGMLFFYPQVLIAELRMLDSKMNEYKSENQRLANELANIKKKYLSQKKLHRWHSTTLSFFLCHVLASVLVVTLCYSTVSRWLGPKWSSWSLCHSWAANLTSLEEASGLTTLWEDDGRWYLYFEMCLLHILHSFWKGQ